MKQGKVDKGRAILIQIYLNSTGGQYSYLVHFEPLPIGCVEPSLITSITFSVIVVLLFL